MTRLTWDAIGERFYETGVDRGVLYVDNLGYSWPGLVSVSESPTGGEAKSYYIDGYKYLNLASAEEFEATIEAYSAPPQFAQCEGVGSAYVGLLVTNQPRRSFGFCYRTGVGNDTDGPSHAYKLHIVYNALAVPSKRNYTTVNDDVEAPVQSWDISTLAPRITGFRPTAHFIIDSRTTPEVTLALLENTLYGSSTTAPTLPAAHELLTIFGAPVYDGGVLPASNGDTIMDGGTP
jgi:hypothetical protein